MIFYPGYTHIIFGRNPSKNSFLVLKITLPTANPTSQTVLHLISKNYKDFYLKSVSMKLSFLQKNRTNFKNCKLDNKRTLKMSFKNSLWQG